MWEQNDREVYSWIVKAPVMLSMALLDEPLSRYSVSIQSMNQWLLIRFQGVTMLFLFVVTSSLALWGLCAPAWQRHHLLWWRKREMGRQELGDGNHWKRPSRLFLSISCYVMFHTGINVSICVFMNHSDCNKTSVIIENSLSMFSNTHQVRIQSLNWLSFFFLLLSLPNILSPLILFLHLPSIQLKKWEDECHKKRKKMAFATDEGSLVFKNPLYWKMQVGVTSCPAVS